MAVWEEWYQQILVGIQGTGGQITQRIIDQPAMAYATDDDTLFQTLFQTFYVSGGNWINITLDQLNAKLAVMRQAFPNTSTPDGISRSIYCQNETSAENMLLAENPVLVGSVNNPRNVFSEDYIEYEQSGYNITRLGVYVFNDVTDSWAGIGELMNSWAGAGAQFADPGPLSLMWNNSHTTSRAWFNFCIVFRVFNGESSTITKLLKVQVFRSESNTGWKYTGTLEESTGSTHFWIDLLNRKGAWVEGDSPYYGVEPSSGEGGPSTGTFDWTPDDISEPELPTYSSVDTGFTRIYNPTLAQLQDFAAYMWTDTSIWSTIWNKLKQYFEDPMDAFIALNMLPCEVPNDTNPETVKICFLSTRKQMYPITNQFVKVDCGSVDLSEIWGSALDYSPNTKIDLFLPFVGTVPIDPDEVMGHTVTVKYTVDVVTGNCLATVAVNGENTESVLYQFSGHCAISIPFSSADFSAYVSAAIEAAKAAVVVGTAGAAAGAAASTAAAAPAAASGGATSGSAALVPVGLPPPNSGAIGPATPLPLGQPNSGDTASFGHLGIQKLDGVGTSPTAKPSFTHTGGFTGNTGFMGVKYPYFIIKSPRMVNPDQYGQMNGYPSMIYTALSACTGFTQVQQIHLGSINATVNERDEILSFLKSGVIL